MTVYMTNREICLKAAERLREVGWRQGDFGGADGPHCLVGACMWVTGPERRVADQVVPTDVAYVAGGAAYAHTHGSGAYFGDVAAVMAWNDEPGRTVEEVIATLEACP